MLLAIGSPCTPRLRHEFAVWVQPALLHRQFSTIANNCSSSGAPAILLARHACKISSSIGVGVNHVGGLTGLKLSGSSQMSGCVKVPRKNDQMKTPAACQQAAEQPPAWHSGVRKSGAEHLLHIPDIIACQHHWI